MILYIMPHSTGKVVVSRQIRKGSKKQRKKSSKKSNNMDFSSILNEMDGKMQTDETMQSMQGMQMPGMQGMQMPGMQMPGMDPTTMAQMAMPNMGVPQMMMGATPDNVDPLHLQHFIPQNQTMNINNFGVNPEGLMSGDQMAKEFGGPAPVMAPQMGGGNLFNSYDSFINKFI